MKSRRVGFCLSSRQEEVTGFKSWRHRHPTTHTVFSASPTLPRSPFQTLSVSTAVSALPTHSTSSPPSLTVPTARLPLSSLGRPCKCFRSIQRLPMCAQTSPPPPPPPFSPPPRHPPTDPTTLAALASVLEVFKGFQCVPKPPPRGCGKVNARDLKT